MTDITFTAPEYQADQSIQTSQYHYHGSAQQGWVIERNGHPWLELGPGYVPVKTLFCGICSTDLARHRLPFSLPQVTGHEVIGEYQGQAVAIEINASHDARGLDDVSCEYCRSGQASHCPERLTLGIDRLPGGFSPWVLAPLRAIHKLPENIAPRSAVFIEPFAAALRAVEVTKPQVSDRVAVLGPRRLGMLVIAALNSYRKLSGVEFAIVAVMRHPELQATALALGADKVRLIDTADQQQLHRQFDIVFDTTGSPQGLELALSMALRTVHLKSTHGQAVAGLEHLTTMVINEQYLAGMTRQHLGALQANLARQVGGGVGYISPGLLGEKALETFIANMPGQFTVRHALNDEVPSAFEYAVVNSIQDINALTRPLTLQGQARLKAVRGILLASLNDMPGSILQERLAQDGIMIETSRCGSFAQVLQVWQQLPELAGELQKQLVTHIFPVAQLDDAMQTAAKSNSGIKVVVETAQA